MARISMAALAKLASLAIGISLGAALYAYATPAWLFQIDGRYLTVTQPRAMQALSSYHQLAENPEHEQFILFGGSGAYHAINADYLSELLSKKRNRPVEVVLIAFESQSLFDTLGLIEALPPTEGAPRHVVFTWSFWRFFQPPERIIRGSAPQPQLPFSRYVDSLLTTSLASSSQFRLRLVWTGHQAEKRSWGESR